MRPPTRKSISVSVRVVRAGEAKLRERARGIRPPVAKAWPDQMFLARRAVPAVSRTVSCGVPWEALAAPPPALQ